MCSLQLYYVGLCLVLTVGSHKSDNFIHEQADLSPTGRLSAACVTHYQKLFLEKPPQPPPRRYMYFHEAGVAHTGIQATEADDNYRFRIVGGKQIAIQQAPYQVMYGQYCGGALISPVWVITAAHCKNKATYVSIGSSYRTQGRHYPICAHFTHPGFHCTNKPHPFDYDYQLVLLEFPVPISDSSRPIAIGTLEDLRPGILLSVSGWGHLAYNTRMSMFLNRVHVPMIRTEECLELGPQYNITERLFCAGFMDGNKDACQGDSGGPVVVNGFLVGTVSYGIGCGLRSKPGVYANLPLVRDWIRKVTALPL